MADKYEQTNQKNYSQSSNEEFVNPSALQLRLDSSNLLQQIEVTLRGYRYLIVDDGNGNPIETIEQISKPLANDEGIHWIVGLLRTIVNPQFVQGFWDEDRFIDFNVRVRKKFAKDLMLNLYRYNIDPKNYNPICDIVCIHLEGFTSRLKNNSERNSYVGTINVNEMSKGTDQQHKSSGWNLFQKKGG